MYPHDVEFAWEQCLDSVEGRVRRLIEDVDLREWHSACRGARPNVRVVCDEAIGKAVERHVSDSAEGALAAARRAAEREAFSAVIHVDILACASTFSWMRACSISRAA